MLSMSSVSHVSVKHIKLLRRKSPSNRTNAVSSSVLFWRARTFDRVIVGRGCLLPRFFSRSLTPPLDPRFLLFFSFPITSTMSQRFTFKSGHGVWHWKENKNSRVYQDGGSLMSVFTLKENRRHKVAQKVAHHHKQNTLRCHLHTLVCTLSQMYNVHKKHNSTMTRQKVDEPRVSHRVALPSPLCKVFHPASAFPVGKSSKYSTPTYTCSHGTC